MITVITLITKSIKNLLKLQTIQIIKILSESTIVVKYYRYLITIRIENLHFNIYII